MVDNNKSEYLRGKEFCDKIVNSATNPHSIFTRMSNRLNRSSAEFNQGFWKRKLLIG